MTTVNPDGSISTQEVPVTGQVLVFLGGPEGLQRQAAWTREDLAAEETLGIPVASAGDVNADGYDDILIGSPRQDVYVLENGVNVLHKRAGSVYLYLGSSDGPELDVSWTYSGAADYGQFGMALAGAGDVNNDGYDDVIIGAPDNKDSSGVYVFLGSASGLKARPAMVLESDQADSFFGVVVKGIGDINGDGYEDVAVSAPYYTTGTEQSGEVFVYLGVHKSEVNPLGDTPLVIEAPAGITLFGYSIAGAGDVNGDGYDDLMIRGLAASGPDAYTGVTFLYLGSKNGFQPVTIQLHDGKDVYPFAAGTQSLVMGDVNGDGISDMMLGAWSHGANSEGAVFVYRGGEGFDFATPVIGAVDFDHVFDRYGVYTVTVTAQVPGGTYVGSASIKIEGYPVAVDDVLVTDEDTPVTFTFDDLLANDYDPDPGDTVFLSGVDISGLTGTLTFVGGATPVYRYSPNGQFEYLKAGQTGVDTFTYTIRDKHGATSTGTVTIMITPVLPVLTDWHIDEDSGVDGNDKLTNDTTPVLYFTFSEAVYGHAGHITVLDPGGAVLAPDSISGWGTRTLTVRFTAPLVLNGAYRVTLGSAIMDEGKNPLNAGAGYVATFVLDTRAPRVIEVVINGGASQRSNITSLELRFSDDMNIPMLIDTGLISDYIRLFNLSTPESALSWVESDRFRWNAETRVLIIDTTVDGFGGSEVTAFEDGYIEIRLNTSRLRDAAGNRLLEDDAVINGWLVLDRTTGSQTYDLFRLLGDSNGDAKVDGVDVAIWQRNYDPKGRNANTPAMGDWNLDGRIDVADLTIWQQQVSLIEMPRTGVMQLRGDANGDGKVDGIDLAIWQRHYDPVGGSDHGPDTGDWNGDGLVDMRDLSIWQQNYSPYLRTDPTPVDKNHHEEPPQAKTVSDRAPVERTLAAKEVSGTRLSTEQIAANSEPTSEAGYDGREFVMASECVEPSPGYMDGASFAVVSEDVAMSGSGPEVAGVVETVVEDEELVAKGAPIQQGGEQTVGSFGIGTVVDGRDGGLLNAQRGQFLRFDTTALFEAVPLQAWDREQGEMVLGPEPRRVRSSVLRGTNFSDRLLRIRAKLTVTGLIAG